MSVDQYKARVDSLAKTIRDFLHLNTVVNDVHRMWVNEEVDSHRVKEINEIKKGEIGMELLQKSVSQLNEVRNMTEESKLEELTSPEVVPKAEKLPESTVVKTEQQIADCASAEETFEALAERKGYIKKPTQEPPATIQFKIAGLTFLSLVIGDIIYFLSNSIRDNTWFFTAIGWQLLIISVMKDFSAVLIGKIIKYYNAKDDIAEIAKKN